MRAEPFAEADLVRDAFLGGAVQVMQPRLGYRAGIDPVLLAATIPARSGETVLELGCGAGPALACLAARVPALRLVGLELQPAYAALARRNLPAAEILDGSVSAPPPALRALVADHVMMNPPYFDAASRAPAADAGRETALADPAPLSDWIDAGARRLRARGTLTAILRVERMPALLAAMEARLGALELWPLAPRAGRAPRLILARGRKGLRAPFRLHPALVLHEGAVHERDGEDYAPAVSSVLRDGAALPFPQDG